MNFHEILGHLNAGAKVKSKSDGRLVLYRLGSHTGFDIIKTVYENLGGVSSILIWEGPYDDSNAIADYDDVNNVLLQKFLENE